LFHDDRKSLDSQPIKTNFFLVELKQQLAKVRNSSFTRDLTPLVSKFWLDIWFTLQPRLWPDLCSV